VAHPRMYDDGDPLLARLRALCAALPGSVEKEAWGRPTFRAPKIFALYGASPEHPSALVFRPEDDERPALLADPRFHVPPYFGPHGWLALDLPAEPDWSEVAELVASSFRQLANRTLVREFDDDGLGALLAVAQRQGSRR
jgi:predicted DNA-binding protein (MmcQ/YjbR family)